MRNYIFYLFIARYFIPSLNNNKHGLNNGETHELYLGGT